MLFFAMSGIICSGAQDPHRFDEDLDKFFEISIPPNENIAVFKGSSGIHFGKNIALDCNLSNGISQLI